MITKSRSLCLELTPDKDFTFILWAYKSNAFLNFWFKFCRSPSREVSGMLMTPLIQMPFRSMLFLTLSNGDEIRWFISESSASWKFFFLITMRYSKTQPPDFPPKGSGHVVSNFSLSVGILAQYKTFHVSFKQYL